MADQTAGVGRLYRELWLHARGSRMSLVIAFIFLVGSQGLKLAAPAFSGRAINAIQSQGYAGLGEAGTMALCVFLATVVSWLLHGPGRILERNVALHVRSSISDDLLDRLFGAPLAWHEAQHGSETAHRVQQTTRALYDFAQSQFIYLQSAAKLIGPVIALCVISWPVGLAAVIAYGLLGVIIVAFDRRMRTLAHRENDAERRYWSALSDVLTSILAIFSLRMRHGATDLIRTRLATVFEPLRKTIVLNETKWATVDILTQVVWIGLAALYIWLVTRHGDAQAPVAGATTPAAGPDGKPQGLPIGSLFMVYEYALQAGGVITGIASNLQSLTRQQADYVAATPLMTAPRSVIVDHQAGGDPAFDWRSLRLEDWTYRHADTPERPSVAGLTMDLARGRRYALVGPSGSGKSTLLRLLAGLYAPGDGVLQVRRADGSGAEALSGDQARQFLARVATMVPQDAELFQGTIRENLMMAVSGTIDDDRLRWALRLAQAETFVSAMPGGLEAPLAPRAGNLSGGQRQRLAVARGLLAARHGSILLLDEPTSALDPLTEHALVRDVFAGLPEGTTVIASIHRPQLLSLFDDVLVVNAGRLAAQGPVGTLDGQSRELADFQRRPG